MDTINKTCIYAITHTSSGKCYIGSATRLNSRWNGHTYNLRRGNHHSKLLQRYWDKYGPEAFELTILEECSKAVLLTREQHWIDFMQPEFNTVPFASSPSHDPQVKLKIGAKSKEKAKLFLVRGEQITRAEITKRYGVSRNAFNSRLERGWSVEDAAITPPDRLHTKSGARVHVYEGGLYSLAELLQFAQCSKPALCRRLRMGIPVKAAVEMTPEGATIWKHKKSVESRMKNRVERSHATA